SSWRPTRLSTFLPPPTLTRAEPSWADAPCPPDRTSPAPLDFRGSCGWCSPGGWGGGISRRGPKIHRCWSRGVGHVGASPEICGTRPAKVFSLGWRFVLVLPRGGVAQHWVTVRSQIVARG